MSVNIDWYSHKADSKLIHVQLWRNVSITQTQESLASMITSGVYTV